MKLSERLSKSPYFFKGSHTLFFDWFLKLVFSKKANKGEFIIEAGDYATNYIILKKAL